MSFQPFREDDVANIQPASEGANPNPTLPPSASSSSSPSTSSSSSPSPSPSPSATHSAPTCRVLLRTLTGQLMPVTFPSLSHVSVLQLKQKVEEIYAIPEHFQRTIFAGREMRDGDELISYGVENESVVHLVLRQNQQQQAPGAEGVAAGAGVGVSEAGAGGDPAVLAIPIVAVEGPPVDAELYRTIQLARTVKIFAIIDLVFVVLWALSFWPFIGALFFCIAGYYGCQQFKPVWVGAYGVFSVFSIGLRIFWIYWADSIVYDILVGLGILIEMYIFSLIVRLVRALHQMTQQERELAYQICNAPQLMI